MTSDNSFFAKLQSRWDEGKFVCIGLDPDYAKLPKASRTSSSISENLVLFNLAIIDSTHDIVCAYKPQIAFYESFGAQGWEALYKTIHYIKNTYPSVPVILDAKRGDIGSTNIGYTEMAFKHFKADAITVHPYLGKAAMQPFLDFADKGIIVLVRTSNPGAGEFQDLKINGKPLYQVIAKQVATEWNTNSNCAVVVGATYPTELKEVRKLIGDMPILIPGIGAQGGDLKQTLINGKDSRSQGMIISSSRAIIFASNKKDFAQAAREETIKLHQKINQILAKS